VAVNYERMFYCRYLFYYLFAQKTTTISVTKVSVHELDKKASKLALTVAHKHNKLLRTQHIKIQSIRQSINQSIT